MAKKHVEPNTYPFQKLNWKALVAGAIRQRKSLGFTQQRLAAIAGISTPTLSRFENMKEDIQLSSILAILKTLGDAFDRRG